MKGGLKGGFKSWQFSPILRDTFFREQKIGAFGKPCLCPRDTRHFCHFRRFAGFEQQSPRFTGFGSAKTDPVRFEWGFREGLLKDRFAFFEAYKNPIPERRKLLAKAAILISKKGPVKKKPFKLGRVSFSIPDG